MKAKLIANPSAGRDRAPELLPHVAERLRPLVPGGLDVVLTTARGDGERAAAVAAEEGTELLFVGGGDGTLNEVVNGVARVPGALERVTFALLPLGTGNDFARALGLPTDLDAALDVVAAARVLAVDLGVLGDRVFVNASAGGFVAEVSDAVDTRLKSVAGKLAYVVGGAGALLDHEPLRLRVSLDAGPAADLDVSLFAVASGRTIGGGRLIAPRACLDDGLLDVCVVRSGTGVDLLAVLAEIARGDHVGDERVLYARVRSVELVAEQPFKVNTDGEVLELARASYGVRPRAARFFAPADVPAALNR